MDRTGPPSNRWFGLRRLRLVVCCVVAAAAVGVVWFGGFNKPDNHTSTATVGGVSRTAGDYGPALRAGSASPAPVETPQPDPAVTTPASGTEPGSGGLGALNNQPGSGGVESEEEPATAVGVGGDQFPISSNLAEGAEYPLRDMVGLAVELWRAELTGVGRDNYRHLDDQVPVCCEVLEIDAAAVVFASAPSEPATILVEGHASVEGQWVGVSSRSRWFWAEGTWVGEHDAGVGDEQP